MVDRYILANFPHLHSSQVPGTYVTTLGIYRRRILITYPLLRSRIVCIDGADLSVDADLLPLKSSPH